MIDIKTEIQDYKKINIDELVANGQVLAENIRNSIVLYNKAIESLSTGSEDIAMIELKKAVSLNPQFYEALNLLGICYNHINDNEKAAEIFSRVLKAENNGVKAQKYMNAMGITGQEQPKAVMTRKKVPASPSLSGLQKRAEAQKSSERSRNTKIITYVLCFLAGMVIYGLLSLTWRSPAAADNSGKSNQTTASTQQTSASQDNNQADNSSTLQSELDEANKKIEYYQSAMKLYEAESLAAGKKYEEAANLLITLKTAGFTGGESDKYNSLSSDIMPKAALTAYNTGVSLYNTYKYQEALKALEKVQTYDPNFKKNDFVLYYQGKSYQKLNDSKNAVTFFQKLIDTYPNSYYVNSAKSRIAQLTKNP